MGLVPAEEQGLWVGNSISTGRRERKQGACGQETGVQGSAPQQRPEPALPCGLFLAWADPRAACSGLAHLLAQQTTSPAALALASSACIVGEDAQPWEASRAAGYRQ